MKTNRLSLFIAASVLIGSLLFADSVRAQIMGINSASSLATNVFYDVNSLNGGNPGGSYSDSANPWTGSALASSWNDSTTGDSASGTVSTSVSGGSYNISLNNVILSQANGNTGDAAFYTAFKIQYQVGAGGLSAFPIMFPNFLVSGTIQSASGSYASIQGSISYLDGANNLLDTVSYNFLDNSVGTTFNNVSVNGTVTTGPGTTTIAPNSTLNVVGFITFEVDPATINVETVPEPGTLALAGLGAAGLFAFRRRLKI